MHAALRADEAERAPMHAFWRPSAGEPATQLFDLEAYRSSRAARGR